MSFAITALVVAGVGTAASIYSGEKARSANKKAQKICAMARDDLAIITTILFVAPLYDLHDYDLAESFR